MTSKCVTLSAINTTAATVKTKKKRNTTQSIKLKPKRKGVIKKKSPYNIEWRYSWDGLEHLREAIRAAAREVLETERIVKELGTNQGWGEAVIGLICAAIRDPSTSTIPEILNAAAAQRKLRELHSTLVWEYRLDWDFVRKEWAVILDPKPEEAALCEKLILDNKQEQNVQSLDTIEIK